MLSKRQFLKTVFIFTGALWMPKLGILRSKPARAFLTDSASYPPPSSGTYTYSGGASPGTFMPNNYGNGFPHEGETFTDPVFLETVKRVSESYTKVGSDRRRAFVYAAKTNISPNNIYCLLTNGSGAWYAYYISGGLVRQLNNYAPAVENTQWHPTTDNWVAFMTGSQYKVLEITTDTVVNSETITFGSGLLNGGEGNFISSDGKNIVGRVGTTLRWYNKDYGGFYSNEPTGVETYGGGVYMLPSGNGCMNTCFPSRYFSVNHNTRSWNSGNVLHVDNGPHSNVCTDTTGRDWFVAMGSGVANIAGTTPDLGDGAGSYPGILFLNCLDPTNWSISWYLSLGSEMGWGDSHVSGNIKATSPNADWVCFDPYGLDNWNSATPWTPWNQKFREEIFLVNVRTKAYRRLCHQRNRNSGADYYWCIWANLSYDGTLVGFNSNMGRQDNAGIPYQDAYTVTTGLGRSDQNPPSPPKNLRIIP